MPTTLEDTSSSTSAIFLSSSFISATVCEVLLTSYGVIIPSFWMSMFMYRLNK